MCGEDSYLLSASAYSVGFPQSLLLTYTYTFAIVCIRFILFLKHLLSFSLRSLPITPPQAGHNQPLWVVLADYPGEEEGTVRVWQGDLVEVIDISRNEWCLIRPVLHSEETAGKKEEEEEEGVGEWEEEGWVPAGFLKPYSGGGFGEFC